MRLKFGKLILIFFCFYSFLQFSYNFESICRALPCPISQNHNDNKVIINCDEKKISCSLFYANANAEAKEVQFKNMFFLSKKAKFLWLSDNLLQIYDVVGQNNSISLFINFKDM